MNYEDAEFKTRWVSLHDFCYRKEALEEQAKYELCAGETNHYSMLSDKNYKELREHALAETL